jgi:hypothetical protein
MSTTSCPTRRRLLARSLHVGLLGAVVLAQATCAAHGQPVDSQMAPAPGAQDEQGGAGSPAPEQQALPPLTPGQEQDLAILATVLTSSAMDAETRARAAERLLDMNTQQALAALEEALRSGDAPTMQAVLQAMGRRSAPAPELLDAALDVLPGAPEETLDALGMALAKYEDAAFQRVSALAADANRPVAQRLAPIHALGEFPTRESGDELIRLADPERGGDEAVRAAAFRSLRRLSGLDFGDEFPQWRQWWNQVRNKSPDAWDRELVRQYQERNVELERLNTTLAQRYVDLLGQLYPRLPLEEQKARLPIDLRDELAVVRQFAMGRIDILQRSSVEIPEEVEQLLAAMLVDEPSPALRAEAARLLDDLDVTDLAELIAAQMSTEVDRRVLQMYCTVLANRPTAAALEPILARLTDAELSAPAGEALWRLLRSDAAPEPRPESIALAVREALRIRQNPELVRLMAYVGDDGDLSSVIPLLDSTVPEIKTAAAAGLSVRGHLSPLLERADDEAIYPFTVRTLAAGPATIENFRQLAGLRPAPSVRPHWDDAIRTLAARLSRDLVMEADDVLAAIDDAGVDLRAAVLERALDRSPEALPPAQRGLLLVRLTPLLIEQGRALRAFELLDSLNGQVEGELAEAKFLAALLAGRYDRAAQIHAEPQPWVTVLEAQVDHDETTATRLRDEISRRFEGRLEGEVKAAFDAASAKLPAPAPAAGAGEGGGGP